MMDDPEESVADDKHVDSRDESDDVVPAELSESEEIVDPEDTDTDGYVDDPSTPDVNEAKLDRATDAVNALEESDEVPASGASTATRTRKRATQRPKRRTASDEDAKDSSDGLEKLDMTNLEPDAEPPRVGPVTFTKQSVSELKKVKWASAGEVWQYFVVVLVFVIFIVAFVSLLDLLFGSAILRFFG